MKVDKLNESEKIKRTFIALRKYGHIVLNYNTRKAHSKGIANALDWLIVKSSKFIVFVEVKIGKDKLSKGQQTMVNSLASIMGLPYSRVFVFVIKNNKEAETIRDNILLNNLLNYII